MVQKSLLPRFPSFCLHRLIVSLGLCCCYASAAFVPWRSPQVLGWQPPLDFHKPAVYHYRRANPLLHGTMESSSPDMGMRHAALMSHAALDDRFGPIDVILHSAVFWSILVMLSIVGLLLVWEESVKTLRKTIPSALLPVIESMLGEMGGLGFIGLFLSIFVTDGIGEEVIGGISEKFLGQKLVLIETFEFLHSAFFEVGIGFFLVSGLIVANVVNKIQRLSNISSVAVVVADSPNRDISSLSDLANIVHAPLLVVDREDSMDETSALIRKIPKKSYWLDLFMTDEGRRAECLLIREGLLFKTSLPKTFPMESYFETIFGRNLEEMVELSPASSWLPLIPIFALGNSIDVSHDVISASSSNAAMTAGEFITTWWFALPSCSFSILCAIWGVTNYWKMSHIKSMLLPTLVRSSDQQNDDVTLLPPRYRDKQLLQQFDSSPWWLLKRLESLFAKQQPARTDHERLFGTAGAAGPSLYRDSIKFHTWCCVSQIVFYGVQHVIRDSWILLNHPPLAKVGNPDGLVPELVVYGFFVALSIVQLGLTPTTFMNYCIITSVEDLTQKWAIDKVLGRSSLELTPPSKTCTL